MTYHRASMPIRPEAEEKPHCERQQFIHDQEEERRETTISSTIPVEMVVSLVVGHGTLEASWRTSRMNCVTLVFGIVLYTTWQGQQDLNPRPGGLETAALPAELYPSSPTACAASLAIR